MKNKYFTKQKKKDISYQNPRKLIGSSHHFVRKKKNKN